MNDFGNAQATKIPIKRPKTGGRQKGTPNRATREIKELAGRFTNRAVKQVWKLAKDAKEEDVQLKALSLLLAYACGRPVARQELEHTGEPITRIERVIIDAPPRIEPDRDGDRRDGTPKLVQ